MAQDNGEILPQETPDESNKIIQINIEEQMKTAYIDYSMSVIVDRALPDVRDGLKPVHRRVLFAMHELGNTFNKPHKKCARIVGEIQVFCCNSAAYGCLLQMHSKGLIVPRYARSAVRAGNRHCNCIVVVTAIGARIESLKRWDLAIDREGLRIPRAGSAHPC